MEFPENTPEWVKQAEISADAKFTITVFSWGTWVVWLTGSFKGTWLGGTWLGGTWLGGEWLGGTWRGGTWRGGTWRGGTWLGGTWLGGTWLGGTWLGGTWLGGTWLGGTWLGGEWLGGSTTSRSKYVPYITVEGNIQIGCECRSIADWDKWFKGKEEFQTRRGTLDFKMIFAHYRAVREYKLQMDKK